MTKATFSLGRCSPAGETALSPYKERARKALPIWLAGSEPGSENLMTKMTPAPHTGRQLSAAARWHLLSDGSLRCRFKGGAGPAEAAPQPTGTRVLPHCGRTSAHGESLDLAGSGRHGF
jgi:hypothetical protein